MIFVFEAVGLSLEGFLRHERALKQGLCLLPGRLLASPAVETNCFVALIQLSLGRLLLSRARVCFTGQGRMIWLLCWVKPGRSGNKAGLGLRISFCEMNHSSQRTSFAIRS